jgi:hypothetical protein
VITFFFLFFFFLGDGSSKEVYHTPEIKLKSILKNKIKLDTHTQEPITLIKDQHIVGDFLAHLSTLSILDAMHAHQPLFAKTQKLSMLLTLHDNHHYKNEEDNKYAHTCIAFGGDQVLSM